MNKTLLILKHEVTSLISRFSFWFGVLGVPLIGFMIISIISVINQSQGGNPDATSNPAAGIGAIFSGNEKTKDLPQGYVDPGKLIHQVPATINSKDLIAFPDTAAAQQALSAGKVSVYYIIPADYVQTGKLVAYTEEFDLVGASENSGKMEELLTYNLLAGDETLIRAVEDPLAKVEKVSLAPQTENTPLRNNDSEWAFVLPYGIMMILFITIMGSSTMLLNSVTKEKENRVIEILMVTADAQQFLLGKIIGLGLVGLLQVTIWASSAFFLLRLSGRTINLPPEFQIEPSLILWGVIYFVLGFLVYASLMAGIGALVPSMREASQATTIVTLPLIAPLFVISALVEAPNSALATGLSLFPLTAPTTMMLRLTATTVPLWQLLLAVALLIVTDWLVIRAVAGMFRAQTMFSGQTFNLKRFFLALAGRTA